MKQSINQSQFIDAFHNMDRGDQFSHQGLCALYNWLEQYEEDTGEEIELDVIALCCDFTEYESFDELRGVYPDIETVEDLEDHTVVIMLDDGEAFIIQDF